MDTPSQAAKRETCSEFNKAFPSRTRWRDTRGNLLPGYRNSATSRIFKPLCSISSLRSIVTVLSFCLYHKCNQFFPHKKIFSSFFYVEIVYLSKKPTIRVISPLPILLGLRRLSASRVGSMTFSSLGSPPPFLSGALVAL